VVTASGCWEWQGTTDAKGYASVTTGSRVDGTYRTGRRLHRVLFEELHGELGDLTVDHLCFNTSCVNPDHLQALTAADNTRRRSPQRKPRGPNMVRYQRTCTHCGDPFEGNRKDQLYCRPACRVAACKARAA
jgi:Rieske Fe-S protein